MQARLEVRLKILTIFIVLLAFGLFLFTNWQTLHKPLTHDEVDYIVCSEKGIWRNAVGSQTLSLQEFVTLGKLKKDRDTLAIAEYAAGLVDPNQDVFVLRHYHPPLPVYFWSFFNSDDTQMHETLL